MCCGTTTPPAAADAATGSASGTVMDERIEPLRPSATSAPIVFFVGPDPKLSVIVTSTRTFCVGSLRGGGGAAGCGGAAGVGGGAAVVGCGGLAGRGGV